MSATTLSAMPPPGLSRDIALRAARWLVSRHAIPADDLEAAAQDIARVYRAGMDGYALARALETGAAWTSITTEVVNDLDAMPAVVQQELLMARRQWVSENNIQPPFPDGAQLVQGQIVGVYEFAPATYRVRERGGHAHSRHILVPFEEAVALSGQSNSTPDETMEHLAA